MESIESSFNEIFTLLEEVKNISQENEHLAEDRKIDLNFIKAKIHSLTNTLRKIELSIVQVAALSINGAVEAIRIGELGEGFSEVSRDIRDLATTSEENLDKVIETIDKLQEENDIMLVEINNILLNQQREIEKLQKIEVELKRNKANIENAKAKIDRFIQSVEEMKTALEQAKIAAEQIAEAANLSHENVKQSKEAASLILATTKDMRVYVDKLAEMANSLV